MAATLRPYQIEAVQAVKNDWYGDHPSTLLVAATGSGKTQIYLEIATTEIPACNGRCLVLVHRDELVEQPRARIRQFWPEWDRLSGTIKAKENDTDARLTIASVQSLVQQKRIDSLLSHGPITHAIIDECFPAGTLVDGRPIESIRVGDYVTAFNESNERTTVQKVIHTFKKRTRRLVRLTIGIQTLVCTPNHPIYTSFGWRPAGILKCNDMVQCTTDTQSYEVQSAEDNRGDVCRMRETGHHLDTQSPVGLQAKRENVLLKYLQEYVYQAHKFRDDDADQSEVCFRENEGQQPYGQRRSQGAYENNASGNGVETNSQRGQWNWPDDPPTTSSVRFGVGYGSFSLDRNNTQERSPSADLLQSGHRKSYSQNSNRNRRKLSLCSARTGREERKNLEWVRVDRIEVLEPGSDGSFGGLCPGGLVYNLEVENFPTYTANGVVVHNCHHSTASTYKSIVNQLRQANPNLKLLGVTATPIRSDKKGLIEMFSHVAARFDIRLLVRLGYLVPPKGMAVATGADLSKTKHNGEYDGDSVAEIFGKANTWELVVESHKKYAHDRKSAIAFTPNVKSAYELAEAFCNAGISAEAADGTTPITERRAVLDRFRSGKTRVIVNCGLWTEGVDIPQIDCVHWCRPTTSDMLYVQSIGRGLRPYPEKIDCTILDYVPLDNRNIVMAGDILGRLSSEGGDIGDDAGTREHTGEAFAVDSQGNLDYGDPEKLIARSLDYLNATPYEWHLESNRATLAITGWNGTYSQILEIHAARNGQCLLVLITNYGRQHPVRVTKIATGNDVQDLIAQGSDYADKHAESSLIQRGRSWRQMPPSPAQLDMLHWFDVPSDRIESLSKGEASRLITHYQAQQALERFSETVRR